MEKEELQKKELHEKELDHVAGGYWLALTDWVDEFRFPWDLDTEHKLHVEIGKSLRRR